MGNQRSVVTHPSRANSWGALTPWRTRLRCACVGEWPHWACVTLFTLIGSVLWNWSINQWKKYIIISTNHEGPEAFQISLFQDVLQWGLFVPLFQRYRLILWEFFKSSGFFRAHGVLPNVVKCPTCHRDCIYRESQRIWRCTGSYLMRASIPLKARIATARHSRGRLGRRIR